MGILDSFRGKKDNNYPQRNLSTEDFIHTPEIKHLIAKYRKVAIILHPKKSLGIIRETESKFGGLANIIGFGSYPCCDVCSAPLNFVLQLYKSDFPDFYFPKERNLFQLFRCPNSNCKAAYSEQYDHKMFVFYFANSATENKQLIKPDINLKDIEPEVVDCSLHPEIISDFPNYDDFDGSDFSQIDKVFGEHLSEYFMDNYSSVQRTKIGGYPSYTQSPSYPVCNCGKTKEFFFQLSSEDQKPEKKKILPPYDWSAHGIMIGDLGNIYFYVCPSCGENTIESNWDCY